VSARRACTCILRTDISTAMFSRRERRGDAGLYLAFALPLSCFLALVALFFLGGLRRSLLPSEQALAELFGSSRVEASNMPFNLLCLGMLNLRQSLLLLGVSLHLAAHRQRCTVLRHESAGETRDSILPSLCLSPASGACGPLLSRRPVIRSPWTLPGFEICLDLSAHVLLKRRSRPH